MQATNKSAVIAEGYYHAMGKKDAQELEKYLHEDVEFTAPLQRCRAKRL